MDIQALQSTLRTFAEARNWRTFHTPKNLSAALMVKAAELAGIFQWMTTEESQAAHLYPATKERIADEVADVFLYLLQVADHSAIDVQSAVTNKLTKNTFKYPALDPAPMPTQVEQSAVATNDTGSPVVDAAVQTHVLVDWENVQPKDVEIQALLPDVTDVWLFHGPNQKNVSANQSLWGQRVTLVPISRAGKNALDFHLSFYIGYIASRHPKANFVVLSNDTGYLPMLEHAQTLGFSAQQCGFQRTKAPASQPSATAKTDLPNKAVGSNDTKAKSVSAKVQKVLPKAEPARQSPPTKKASKAQPPKPSVAQKAAGSSASKSAKKVVSTKKAPAVKKKSTAPTLAGVLAEDRSPEQQQKPKYVQHVDTAVRHVKASLKKMTSKPTRKARLVAAITSLLNDPASDSSIVNDVLAELERNQFVVISDKGLVSFPG